MTRHRNAGTTRSAAPSRRGAAGFTLPEMMIAATLSAMLLIAMASSAGMFGRQMTYLKEESTNELEMTLANLAKDIRYAWHAEVPVARTLELTDPSGAKTTYQFGGGKLTVIRPDGARGPILEDLVYATFAAEKKNRYREDTPVTRAATLWSATKPTLVLPQAHELAPGDKIALGFMADSAAPLPMPPVDDIGEQLLDAALTTLTIPVAAKAGATGGITISLYRARAPGDARPEGAALASTVIAAHGLPTAIVVGLHGGPMVVLPPVTSVTVSLSAMGASILPGRAYTIVIEKTGAGDVVLTTYPTGSAEGSGIATSVAGGAYTGQALRMARSIGGLARMTKTTATPVIERIRMALKSTDGTEVTGSAVVIGQRMAEHAWTGVVPGEVLP